MQIQEVKSSLFAGEWLVEVHERAYIIFLKLNISGKYHTCNCKLESRRENSQIFQKIKMVNI